MAATYGDCEYGTVGGHYGTLCLIPPVVPAAPVGGPSGGEGAYSRYLVDDMPNGRVLVNANLDVTQTWQALDNVAICQQLSFDTIDALPQLSIRLRWDTSDEMVTISRQFWDIVDELTDSATFVWSVLTNAEMVRQLSWPVLAADEARIALSWPVTDDMETMLFWLLASEGLN